MSQRLEKGMMLSKEWINWSHVRQTVGDMHDDAEYQPVRVQLPDRAQRRQPREGPRRAVVARYQGLLSCASKEHCGD